MFNHNVLCKCFMGALLLIFGQSGQIKAQPSQTLKVMTYNIQIGKPINADINDPKTTDLRATAEVINSSDPDLVALQEVDVYTQRSGTDLHEAKELARLTGMNYYFAKALDRSGGDYGVAILSKFPIKKSRTISLPVTEGSDSELRAAAITTIEVPGNEDIIFISTHLYHLEEKNRTLQIETLIEALKGEMKYPIVLAGDFNTQLQDGSKTMEVLNDQFDPGCTACPNTFSSEKPSRAIDYMFLNKKM